jgi:hypothetical protein
MPVSSAEYSSGRVVFFRIGGPLYRPIFTARDSGGRIWIDSSIDVPDQ